ATEVTASGLARVPPAKARTDPETADLIEVDVNEWRCPKESRLKFVYDASHTGFARDVDLRTDLPHTATRILLPVFATFQGVSFGGAPPGCLAGVYRVEH